MINNSDLNWLTQQSRDEVYSFNSLAQRQPEFESIHTYHSYILYHAEYFFTPLNQIYLYLISDLSLLGFFDKVFVRDGLLTLKLFFLRNPKPEGLTTQLIINSRFKNFIPVEWKNNVLFYRHSLLNKKNPQKRFLIIVLHVDSLHCPDTILAEQLTQLTHNQYEEVICLLTGMPQYGSSEFINKNIFNKSVIISQKIKVPFRAMSLNDLNPRLIADSHFLESNPYHFLFSDCYLRWYLIYHGSFPINDDWLVGDVASKSIHKVQLSPHHQVEIFPSNSDNRGSNDSINERDFFSEDIIPSRNHMINLCSESYKSYVNNLAIDHAKKSN
jgi:hypothetical protein